jgi:hypothetical protein
MRTISIERFSLPQSGFLLEPETDALILRPRLIQLSRNRLQISIATSTAITSPSIVDTSSRSSRPTCTPSLMLISPIHVRGSHPDHRNPLERSFRLHQYPHPYTDTDTRPRRRSSTTNSSLCIARIAAIVLARIKS